MEDYSHVMWVVAIFFITLSWITVALRVYVRTRIIKSFGKDDWFMVGTLILFSVYVACQMGGLIYGTGKHASHLTRENETKALRFWYLCEIFYITSSSLLKISIGIFLLRVSVHPIHVWIIRFVILGTIVFGTMYLFVAAFQCHPVADFWRIDPGAKTCLDPMIITNITYAAGALVSVSDWTYGILPLFIVWDLQMTKKAKSLVACLLAFAAIGCIATVVRIPYAHSLSETDDFLWATSGIAIWSTVEVGIGITAGSVATLRPLLQSLLWKVGLASTMPNSSGLPDTGRNYSSRLRAHGYQRNRDDDDDPEHFSGMGVQMVTTITGNKGTKDKKNPNKSWVASTNGSEDDIIQVSKRVEVEYEETEVKQHYKL